MFDLEAKTKEFKKKLRSSVLTKEWLERTIISLGLYGKVSGVIGPFIIANLNGRMIIRLRPKNFQKSQTKASVAGRKNMASANKLAMFLKSIPSIYEVWGKAKIEGLNPFTRLIKHNKKHLINYHPSVNSIITPEGYSLIADNLVSVEKKGIIRISKNYQSNENEKLIIIIIGCNPLKKGYGDFESFEINSSPVSAGDEIKLSRGQKCVLRNYSKFILYYALVRKDGGKILWSNTCALNVEFIFGCDYELAEAAGYGQILTSPFDFTPLTVLVKPPG